MISSRIVFVSFARSATSDVPGKWPGAGGFRASARRAATHRGDDAVAAGDAGDADGDGDDDS